MIRYIKGLSSNALTMSPLNNEIAAELIPQARQSTPVIRVMRQGGSHEFTPMELSNREIRYAVPDSIIINLPSFTLMT